MDNEVVIPYKPVRVGSWYDQARATVYGFAFDHENTLIALSVQANNITTEQIHYKIQGQNYSFSLQSATGLGYSRHARTHDCHFEVVKNPIPDTSDVSMILLNESLFKINKDLAYTHVWYRNSEDFKNELWQRVKEIVYCPVLPEWASYLMTKGMTTEVRRVPLCGRLTNITESSSSWLSAGFDIAYIANNREAWQKVISDGLNQGKITVDGSDPAAIKPKVIGGPRETLSAILYIAGGESKPVMPANGTDFKLEEVYDLLDVEMVEVVYLDNEGKMILICDENGKMVDEEYWQVNEEATKIFVKHHGNIDIIVGNALYCPSDMFR